MLKTQSSKHYDLEDRSFNFAKRCADFIRKAPRTLTNIEYCKQLARASRSQAANYIEANESLSKKDFAHRIKISRKESKESRLWLRLIEVGNNNDLQREQESLIVEALELTKIYGSIVEKSQ